jgi:uncharacterized protein with PIN domain
MYTRNLTLKSRESKYYKTIRLRFYAELNNFLPVNLHQRAFDYSFPGPITVKEVIESMKVPFSEVDLILINGEPVDFNFPVSDQDYISVYPVFEQFDISGISQLRKIPLRTSRFILDAHLGKLAKYLRMAGFDTLYENNYSDNTIREIASSESRIILTRDRDLLTSKNVTHGYYVRNIHSREQMAEVVQKFDLYSRIEPFTRCLICNSELREIDKKEIPDEIDADTKRIFNEFFYCDHCKKIYWKGSHYERMMKFLKSLKIG